MKTFFLVLIYKPEAHRRVEQVRGVCEWCHTVCGGRLDPHHYAGSRKGPNLLRFVILGRPCHDFVHEFPNRARADGWLSEINGTLTNPHPAVLAAEKRYKQLLKELNL